MKKSKIVHGHEVTFETDPVGSSDIDFDDDCFIELHDFPGFGEAFWARVGVKIFDLVASEIERFYSRGRLAYSDISCSDIPSELVDFMDAGGSVDGFMRKFKALKRAGE